MLWDKLPDGMFLGGAPLNVALNAHQLGMEVLMVSAVGKDEPGSATLKELEIRGLSVEGMQRNDKPTGLVDVNLEQNGIPVYDIKYPAAWDEIAWREEIQNQINNSDAVVFGTLAQRHKTSRESICRYLENTSAKKVLDINIRTPFDSPEVIRESLEMADILKLNEEELSRIGSGTISFEETLVKLQDRYRLECILLTLGARGAVMLRNGMFTRAEGINIKVADTIGAGDAFLAGAVSGILTGKADAEILAFANRLGAFVASRHGATPELKESKKA